MPLKNPYESPTAVASGGAVPRATKPPFVISIVLWVFGVFFLLLLNGQHFTNGLVFLGAIVVSGVLWTRYFVRSNNRHRLATYALLFHLVIAVAVTTVLPKRYRRQQQFNNRINELRERGSSNSLSE